MTHLVRLAVLSIFLSTACGSSGGPAKAGGGAGGGGPGDAQAGTGGTGGTGGGTGASTGGDALAPDERDRFDRGADAIEGARALAVLADGFFSLDPTVDPTKTAAQNAQSIEQRLRSLVSDAGVLCGTYSVSSSTVTAAFGPPPGCTLQNGVKVSGTAVATVTQSGGTTAIAFTFTSVVVDGKSLSGTASFATTNGTTFTVAAKLTSGTTTYTVTSATLAGSAGTFTLTGTVTMTTGTTTSTMTFTAVTWKAGDCYPNGGTLKITKGLVTSTVTFSASTPTTGQVTVTTGRKTSTATLPTYGSCGAGG